MPGQQQDQQPWRQPSREELLQKVAAIVEGNPGRHNQGSWLSNVFSSSTSIDALKVEEIQPYAMQELPVRPADRNRPVCGTQGCVAGWLAVLGSPPGTTINYGHVFLPDGTNMTIGQRAREVAVISDIQSFWLFSADRSREEIVPALEALIADVDAELDLDDGAEEE